MIQGRDRLAIARRIAEDIPEGWFVNLGIGMPTAVSDYIPPEREVIFHAENGVIGIGPAPAPEEADPYLVNAGVQPITLLTGAALVHHADSFAIARGGHLDLCVLGAFQVDEAGDLANWAHGLTEPTRQIGGAMDLAVGAQRVWVAMEHCTKAGEPRLLPRCTYPLTARGVVQRVYTDLAVLEVTAAGFAVREMVPGLDFAT
ncbi:MAG: 3-oxoacid CoA-transferase subunit B, partial [Rhodospirillales bacterium]|nr:3-oxoacid CoA-transferase subunit B [Rhodospirillales bacterium]